MALHTHTLSLSAFSAVFNPIPRRRLSGIGEMALHTHTLSLSAFSAVFNPIPRNSLPILSPSSTLPFPIIHPRRLGVAWSSSTRWIPTANRYNTRRVTRLKSADEETLVPEQEDEQTSSQPEVDGEPSTSENDQQSVVVPVSPADTLTMFFQADGSMSEAAIPALTKALEETEGVTNLKVQVVEGVASVELAKLTTVQATGVASTLVETIQGSGFKLQTLNLSFEDEEVVAV